MQNSTQHFSSPASPQPAFANLSDKELYKKCQLYGAEARKWTRKFADLLPEVVKRELYKKYGFYSIFEFAAKLAGMKHETVVDILRITQKLEDKPLLRAQMETAGWGKLKVIATIATKENEKMLAEKVATMSKSTLETFVREFRRQNEEKNVSQHSGENSAEHSGISQHFGENVQSRTGSAEDEILSAFQPVQANLLQTTQGANSLVCAQQPVPHQSRIFVRLLLTPKNELKLKELQKKLSREQKAPVDLNEVVGILLDAYEKRDNNATGKPARPAKTPAPAVEKSTEFAKLTQMQKISAQTAQTEAKLVQSQNPKPPSRHIQTKIEKELYQKYQGRCAWPGCTKLPEIFHHMLRFSLNPSHNSDTIVPLCKNHERLAHHGLIENEEMQPENWRLRTEPDKNALKYQIDQKVISHYSPQ